MTITRVDPGRKVTVQPYLGEIVDGARAPIVLDDRFSSMRTDIAVSRIGLLVT